MEGTATGSRSYITPTDTGRLNYRVKASEESGSQKILIQKVKVLINELLYNEISTILV